MIKKKYGEFKCEFCDKIFFTYKQYMCHVGGAHKKGITEKEKPRCKHCGDLLIAEGAKKNWPDWAIEQKNLICAKCKNIINKKAYHRRKEELLKKKGVL